MPAKIRIEPPLGRPRAEQPLSRRSRGGRPPSARAPRRRRFSPTYKLIALPRDAAYVTRRLPQQRIAAPNARLRIISFIIITRREPRPRRHGQAWVVTPLGLIAMSMPAARTSSPRSAGIGISLTYALGRAAIAGAIGWQALQAR